MGLLAENKKILEEKYTVLLDELNETVIDSSMEIVESLDGKKIVKITKDNHEWYLNSKNYPEEAADIFAKRYSPRIYGQYYVFGFSDGRCIRKMIEEFDETNRMVIYEPDIRIFKLVLENIDISDILSDDRVVVCIPDTKMSPEKVFASVIQYNNIKVIECCNLPAYDILYRDQCEKFDEIITEQMRREHVHRATRLSFNRLIPQSTLYHMKNMLSHYNPYQLKQEIEKFDISHVPAIIVSAGPSLDKNVNELKAAQGKALIIVVDAALRTVLQAGVRPDLVYTVDPESPDRFFENLELDGMNWVCERITRPWIVQNYGKRVLYCGDYLEKWNKRLEEELGYDFPKVISGGSVTTVAFMLAIYLGFRKLILVGQDMAFTNGVSHTKGINEAFGDNDEYIKSRCVMEVEGINGEILETDFQMFYYRKWFEKIIRLNKDEFEVINATEGGAKIEGTVNRPLKEVIEEECQGEIDVYTLAQNLPQMFSEEQRKILMAEIMDMKNQLHAIKEDIHALCELQDDIIHMLQNGETDGLKGKIDKMMTETDKLNDNMMFELMMLYAQKEEYELSEDIYAQEEMSVEELVQRGKTLLEGYLKGSEMLEEDMEEYLYSS